MNRYYLYIWLVLFFIFGVMVHLTMIITITLVTFIILFDITATLAVTGSRTRVSGQDLRLASRRISLYRFSRSPFMSYRLFAFAPPPPSPHAQERTSFTRRLSLLLLILCYGRIGSVPFSRSSSSSSFAPLPLPRSARTWETPGRPSATDERPIARDGRRRQPADDRPASGGGTRVLPWSSEPDDGRGRRRRRPTVRDVRRCRREGVQWAAPPLPRPPPPPSSSSLRPQ